jgi:hypothetical protein
VLHYLQSRRTLNDLFTTRVFIGLMAVEAELVTKVALLQRNREVSLHVRYQLVNLLLCGRLVTLQAGHTLCRMTSGPIVRRLVRLQIRVHDVTGSAELRLLVVLPKTYRAHAAQHDHSQQDGHHYRSFPRHPLPDPALHYGALLATNTRREEGNSSETP